MEAETHSSMQTVDNSSIGLYASMGFSAGIIPMTHINPIFDNSLGSEGRVVKSSLYPMDHTIVSFVNPNTQQGTREVVTSKVLSKNCGVNVSRALREKSSKFKSGGSSRVMLLDVV
ncbi:hypothetical protein V6N13_124444 [Hibiscus sabdariffa]|uniref:Uncharacterized protein n=1 Tax=Hibiscus sabdariffa TaxID=183260 RepID=A0ABR2S1C5_9ROSI